VCSRPRLWSCALHASHGFGVLAFGLAWRLGGSRPCSLPWDAAEGKIVVKKGRIGGEFVAKKKPFLLGSIVSGKTPEGDLAGHPLSTWTVPTPRLRLPGYGLMEDGEWFWTDVLASTSSALFPLAESRGERRTWLRVVTMFERIGTSSQGWRNGLGRSNDGWERGWLR
jgi:hypothetical protein